MVRLAERETDHKVLTIVELDRSPTASESMDNFMKYIYHPDMQIAGLIVMYHVGLKLGGKGVAAHLAYFPTKDKSRFEMYAHDCREGKMFKMLPE